MSWAEVKKINGNMNEPLDALLKRIGALKRKTYAQTFTVSYGSIRNAQTLLSVEGAGRVRRITVTGAVRTADTTADSKYYVQPGSLVVDGANLFNWTGSASSTYYNVAYIGYQGNVAKYTGNNLTGSASPYSSGGIAGNTADLDWAFKDGFTVNLTALTSPAMGSGNTTVYVLYDLEVDA